MRIEKPENWGDFRHDGILYFAQRLCEMLNHYTPHTYKVPIFSPRTLALEYLSTHKMVNDNTIDAHHLKYILEEFISSFNGNSIINEHFEIKVKERIVGSLHDENIEHQLQIMSYIRQRLEDYGVWCINYAKKIVLENDGKEKKKIEQALRCLIPELIGRGYSHEFIYIYCKKCFFEDNVSSIDCLNTFLDRFDFKLKDYTVYTAAKKTTKSFSKILKKRLGIHVVSSKEAKEKCSDYNFDRKLYILLKKTVSAFDEQSAAQRVFHEINIFLDFFDFVSDNDTEWMNNSVKVFDGNNNSSFVKLFPQGFHVQTDINEKTKYLSDLLIVNLQKDNQHFSQLYRCIKLHNNAISENDLRNGFLNLWSIMEILFVNESDSKIKTIEKAAIPLLVSDYLKSKISILEDLLKDCIPDKYDEIKGNINSNNWFLYFIADSEYDDIRKDVIDNHLADFPLLRTRLNAAHNTFHKTKYLREEKSRIQERITWHLYRLYRTRNAIIHSGEEPFFLKELCEHLHAYIDICINELLFLSDKFHSINSSIFDVNLNIDLFNSYINDDFELDKEKLDKIVWYLSYEE